MNQKDIINYVKKHPSGKVKIAYADIDGILRGKYISTAKFLTGIEKGTSFCDVIMGWDSADVLYDKSTITGWHHRSWSLFQCRHSLRPEPLQQT